MACQCTQVAPYLVVRSHVHRLSRVCVSSCEPIAHATRYGCCLKQLMRELAPAGLVAGSRADLIASLTPRLANTLPLSCLALARSPLCQFLSYDNTTERKHTHMCTLHRHPDVPSLPLSASCATSSFYQEHSSIGSPSVFCVCFCRPRRRH